MSYQYSTYNLSFEIYEIKIHGIIKVENKPYVMVRRNEDNKG